jgi:hypothetical protein
LRPSLDNRSYPEGVKAGVPLGDLLLLNPAPVLPRPGPWDDVEEGGGDGEGRGSSRSGLLGGAAEARKPIMRERGKGQGCEATYVTLERSTYNMGGRQMTGQLSLCACHSN